MAKKRSRRDKPDSNRKTTAAAVPPPRLGTPAGANRMRFTLAIASVVLGGLLVFGITFWAVRNGGFAAPTVTAEAAPTLVDNATCVGCHQAEARAWSQSHHAKAMAKPSPATVVGDFGGTAALGHGQPVAHSGIRQAPHGSPIPAHDARCHPAPARP